MSRLIFRMFQFILILALFYVQQLVAQDYKEYLVAYWSFEDSTARDFSGNGYHGRIMNRPTPVAGVNGIGTAFRFEGRGSFTADGDHIILPMLPFNTFNEFTITMWVKEEGFSYSAGEAYIFFGTHNYGWCGIMHHIEARHLPNKRYLNFATGAIFDVVINPLLIEFNDKYLNNWTYYCLVYKNNTIYAYINAQLVGSLYQPLSIIGEYAALARHWWKWTNTVETSTRFTGCIDEVKIFKKALTDEEIKQEYNTCGEAQFTFENFKVINKIRFVGDARVENDKIYLTRALHRVKGAAWYVEKVPVYKDFTVDFSFRINDGNNGYANPEGSQPGADGFAFVIQNYRNDAIGTTDWGIGYHGINNSIAIEFDTYRNFWLQEHIEDPNGNHIAVHSLGFKPNSAIPTKEALLGYATNIPTIKSDGSEIYYARIKYLAKQNLLHIYFGQSPTLDNPVLTIRNFNIPNLINLSEGKKAYIGFTAATGDSWETHEILSWSFCPSPDICDTYYPTISSTSGIYLCEGDSTVIYVNEAYKSYHWSTGEKTRSITIKQAGKYTVNVLDEQDCPGTAEIEIISVPNPKPSVITQLIGDSCYIEKAILSADANYKTYEWYDVETGELISNAKSVEIHNSGKYKLKVTNSYDCKNESGKVVIDLKRMIVRPTIISTGGTTLCDGDSLILSVKETYKTYTWSTGERTRNITIKTAGKYIVNVLDTNDCPGSSEIEIILAPNPKPKILTQLIGDSCFVEKAILSADKDYSSYEWFDDNTGELISKSKSVEVEKSGKYKLRVVNSFNCKNESDIENIEINRTIVNPTINSSQGYILCEGDSLILNVKENYKFYNWSTGEKSKSIVVRKAGKYVVNVLDSNNCPGSAEIEIFSALNPKPTIIAQLIGDSCNIEKAILKADADYSIYEWYDFDTGALISNTKSIEIHKSGKYKLKVINNYGCKNESDYINIDLTSQANLLEIVDDVKILKFDSVKVGKIQCLSIKIRNISNNDITISKAFLIENISFSIPQSQLPITLKTGELRELIICFNANQKGLSFDTLLIIDICGIHRINLEGLSVEGKLLSRTRCGIPIALSKNDAEEGFIIFSEPYPNPINKKVYIEFSGNFEDDLFTSLNCQMFNLIGLKYTPTFNIIKLANKAYDSIKYGVFEIFTEDIPNGYYFIRIDIGENKLLVPVVKN